MEELGRIRRVQREKSKELGREADPSEVAAELDTTEARVKDVLDWARDPVSLNMAVDDEGETQFGDLVEDTGAVSPEDAVMVMLRREELDDLIGRLDDRDRLHHPLPLRDGGRARAHPHRGGQAARAHRERIRQIEKRALAELKKIADHAGFEAA